ncbi:MAG: hypothetical protein DRJ64_00645 [Thermoprotei archaeon]|nr:MAG: hypothetical protein DRJ64_00645 [Thermoprotei archaeon]
MANPKRQRSFIPTDHKVIKITLQRVLRYVPKPKSRTYLDLGCGDGRWAALLQRIGIPASQITGIDTDEEHIKNCKEKYPDINWICGDAFDHDHKYDVVIGNPPYNHLRNYNNKKIKGYEKQRDLAQCFLLWAHDHSRIAVGLNLSQMFLIKSEDGAMATRERLAGYIREIVYDDDISTYSQTSIRKKDDGPTGDINTMIIVLDKSKRYSYLLNGVERQYDPEYMIHRRLWLMQELYPMPDDAVLLGELLDYVTAVRGDKNMHKTKHWYGWLEADLRGGKAIVGTPYIGHKAWVRTGDHYHESFKLIIGENDQQVIKFLQSTTSSELKLWKIKKPEYIKPLLTWLRSKGGIEMVKTNSKIKHIRNATWCIVAGSKTIPQWWMPGELLNINDKKNYRLPLSELLIELTPQTPYIVNQRLTKTVPYLLNKRAVFMLHKKKPQAKAYMANRRFNRTKTSHYRESFKLIYADTDQQAVEFVNSKTSSDCMIWRIKNPRYAQIIVGWLRSEDGMRMIVQRSRRHCQHGGWCVEAGKSPIQTSWWIPKKLLDDCEIDDRAEIWIDDIKMTRDDVDDVDDTVFKQI